MTVPLNRIGATTAQSTDSADIEEAASDALVALDAKAMLYGQGLLASRPAAGVAGRIYWATDANGGTAYYDTGSAWIVSQQAPEQRWEPGDFKWSARAASSSGWLLCNYAETPIASYPELYAVIGTSFGALTNGAGGAGSSHFRLPDAAGRGLIAAGAASGITSRSIGAKVGAETHTLASAEMPAHFHGAGSLQALGIATTFTAPSLVGSGPTSAFGVTNTGNKPISGGTDISGGGAAHNNMQPSLVANLFIKT